MSASSSSSRANMSDLSTSSNELCVFCSEKPYDLICTCGDKFCFICVQHHVEQLGMEFEYNQSEVGQRLLQVEQTIEGHSCTNSKTIIENWKRKRIQDINDIADDALNPIQKRENIYSEAPPFRVQYNSLCGQSHRVVHEHLSSMITLQQLVLAKSDQLAALPELPLDDTDLDSKLQSKLNPNVFHQSLLTHEVESVMSSPVITTEMSTESISSALTTTSNTNIEMSSEPISSAPTTTSDINILMNPEPTISASTTTSNENLTVEIEPTVKLTNINSVRNSTTVSTDNDEFDAGKTANIQRRNPIIISASNDKFVATVCCHKNQLLYNDHNQRTRNTRLILIPDVEQPTIKQTIDWTEPDKIIGGGDDDWIQDIAYSTKLQGYLLLNRSRLRLLHDDTHKLEEFHQFPDRSMKRVTCDDKYIYLIAANGVTGQHGDEIILMTYDKEEKLCKTFRDIVLNRNNRMVGPFVGEISDLAVNTSGQLIFSYRLERRQEVGVFLYNISNDRNDWVSVKQLLLNECWHNDLSYTPRIEWCEKLNVFILLEHITSHLIMLDQTGQVQGESRFTHVENRREAPLNLSISTNDWFCVRYESSINIHKLEDDRF